MRTIRDIIRFRLSTCIKTTYFITPMILIIIFLRAQYNMMPQGLTSSMCMTALIVFSTMMWMGYSYEVHEDEVMAQIVILRINNRRIYHIAEILWQMTLSVMIGGVTVLYPIIINAINAFHLFNRTITAMDVVGSFLLITSSGFVGGCVGSIFGPRVMKNRKLALLVIILVTAVTVTKSTIIRSEAIMKYILWILPPVYNVTILYSIPDSFSAVSVLIGTALLCGYGVLAGMVRILIQKKKGF